MVLEADTFHELHPSVVGAGLVVTQHAPHELCPGDPRNVQGDPLLLNVLFIAPILELIWYHQALLRNKARKDFSMRELDIEHTPYTCFCKYIGCNSLCNTFQRVLNREDVTNNLKSKIGSWVKSSFLM